MPQMSRIDELRRRVNADPASFAFAALAEEYRRVGRFDAAIDTCRAGLARHPSYVSARATLGRALLDAGDVEAARTELEQVLQLAPENLTALRGLADLHRRAGELDLALARMSLARSLAPQDAELGAAISALSDELRQTACAEPVLLTSPAGEGPAAPGGAAADLQAAGDTTVGDVVPSSAGDAEERTAPYAPQLAALERFLVGIERARRSSLGQSVTR